MTRQESFKGRIRARMEATGEKYGAARRVLIEKAQGNGWVSDPETSNERVIEATGRGWDQWCSIIDAELGPGTVHSTIAAHLVEHHGVDRWWAQTVTVGYERIKGLRLKHQMADGTFTAGRSRTVAIDGELLRKMLLAEREELFPGFETELRSKPESKSIRIAIGPGTAEIALEPTRDGRTRVTVAHAKLPTSIEVAAWREYWSGWLAALDE
jgi:hypothetical protein